MKRLLSPLLLGLLAPLCLRAHDPGLSTTEVNLRADTVEVTVGYAPADLRGLLSAEARIRAGTALENFEIVRPDLLKLAPGLWEVRADSLPLAPQVVQVSRASSNSLIFDLTYPRPAGSSLSLHSPIFARLPPGHRDYFTVANEQHQVIDEKLIDASTATVAVPLPARDESVTSAPSAPREFWEFLQLGVRHIWTGYDHLLFLFGLLVVCRRFKSIVAIISCFTIAHSLTLALAALNVVQIPSRIVEPAIAASIVFVGVENILRHGAEPAGRWALTFLFGLVHGFGFASALRELGVGANGRGLLLPLVSFNLGVELGQITIAALVLPLVWQFRRQPWFSRQGALALSAVVAAAGLFWFFQRTLFS